jgi:hypothetical protein
MARSTAWWTLAAIALLPFLAEGILQLACAMGAAERWRKLDDVYVPYVEHLSRESTPGPRGEDGSFAGFAPVYAVPPDGPPLWMFGGSTMRGGSGRRPDLICEPERPCTIASHFSDLLRRGGRRYRVMNLGEYGYNINQERILFEELLHRRPRPAIAIFYAGATEATTDRPVAGYPLVYLQARPLMERRYSTQRLMTQLGDSRWKLPFLLDYLLNSHAAPPAPRPFGGLGPQEEGFPADVASNYLHNLRLIRAVCKEFQVDCRFIWQPLRERPAQVDAAVAAGVARSREKDFSDLSGLFAKDAPGVFLDWCHIDESTDGNRRIAAAIYDRVFAKSLVAGSVVR